MKLITKDLEKTFEKYPLYSQENEKDPIVICKFFGGSCCTWLVTEAEKQSNGDYEFFGYANLGYGFDMGYFRLSELEELKFQPFGLGVERDLYLKKGARASELLRD